MASSFPVAASLEAPRRPRGRPPSRSWAFFTTIAEPQKQPAATCRHCQQLVHHHKKWGQARTHLMKCAPFLRLMDTLPPQEVPEWYLAELNRRQQVAINSVPAAFQTQMTQMPPQMTQMQVPQMPNTAAFKSIQPMPNTAVSSTMMMSAGQMQMMQSSANLTPRVEAKPDTKKVEEAVAMHLFTTMAVEQLVAKDKLEIPELVRAFQMCRKDVEMPTREKLMTELLDRCFETVKRRVDGFFKSGLVPVTLTMETAAAAGEGDSQVSYMASLASAEKYPMYLESVKLARSGDDGANAEFAARDVARVVEKLACPVAGCVLPSSSSHSRQTREILEKQFPAMYFHGCLRDSLMHLVRQIFTPTGAAETERKRSATPSFYQDLQQFALQCKDLEFFLPKQENVAYLRESGDGVNTMMHVTARRRLTVEEGFAAILQAEPFLDADNLLNRLFGAADGSSSDGSAGSAHLQTQLMKVVRSAQFLDKLRKYLEVLRPIHALLSSLTDCGDSTALPLSEVYSSFARLSQQFASSALLQPDEKGALHALIRQHQERVVGPAHLLAYLLDPVLLGEDLSADTKTDVEKQLLSSFRGDGASLSDPEKEVLYAQYVDFKKAATHQKTIKSETLVFRTLKERKKSSLQYWFTDGAKWPVLQGIACRVFVMPVCAASSTQVVSEAGVAPRLLRGTLDSLTSDKLTYVRVNARQVQHAAGCGSSLVPVGHSISDESSANDITASMVV